MSKTSVVGKRVAITGAARGIGAAIAVAFVDGGAHVALGDVDAELAGKTAAGCSITHAVGLPVDVTDEDSFAEFLASAEKRLGGLDVVVNNAGIMPTGEFLDEPIDIADRQLDVNLRGVIIGCKLAGARFADAGGGHLVNIASIAGLGGLPGAATYSATKHAVVGLGHTLAQELARHRVLVSTICPSFVNTELIAGLTPNWLTGKIGLIEPSAVAAAVVDAVASGSSGVRVVPRSAGGLLRATRVLPARAQYRLARLFGLHDVMLTADDDKRADYLDRVRP